MVASGPPSVGLAGAVLSGGLAAPSEAGSAAGDGFARPALRRPAFGGRRRTAPPPSPPTAAPQSTTPPFATLFALKLFSPLSDGLFTPSVKVRRNYFAIRLIARYSGA